MKKTKKNKPDQINTAVTVSNEDRTLFRESIGKITKIDSNQIITGRKKPKPNPIQSEQDDADVIKQLTDAPFSVPEVETGDELNFHRAGVQKQTLKKLRKGLFVVESELDLHGLTSITAKPALVDFLNRSLAMERRCVRIIHGKGHGSPDKKPVLKNKLNLWLQQREEVLAFCSARANDGGTGAVYVLLRVCKH